MNSAVLIRPACAAQATRVRRFNVAVSLCIVAFSIGCNADPSCRRETALLRAEILDIEDKYAVLQSRYESTATELHQFTGAPVDQTMYGATSNYHGAILNEQIISNGQVITGQESYPGYVESYPSEQVIYGNSLQGYPEGSVIVQDSGLQLGTPYNQGMIFDQNQNFGQPTNGRIINESIGEGIIVPHGSTIPTSPQIQNGLPLPGDARNQRGIRTDDFDLELPGVDRRSIPAIQASTTLDRSRSISATGRSSATEIMVNRSGTSGQDVDGQLGDEGLNLLLQTKDSRGQIVLQGGELTVSLIDPKQRQRIGFWRFLPGEIELFFVDKNQDTDGILLHLPWDESIPQRPRLLVHVQFITSDGRSLTTSSDVLIKPPTNDYSPDDPQVINWTQSDARWGDSDGGYVVTGVESFDDLHESFQAEERRRAEDDWQKNGTYKRGAKFSVLRDSGDSDDEGSSSRNAARLTEALGNLDQPKWRPVR